MVLQAVKPWISTADIAAGTRWTARIEDALEHIAFGIICTTPENMNAPWLLFEAGAISKSLGTSVVCPYLIGLDSSKLPFPLAQFQAVNATRQGTMRLLRSINDSLGILRIDEDRLRRSFERWWPDLYKALESLPPPRADIFAGGGSTTSLGLVGLYPTRASGLEAFVPYLTAELRAATEEQPARFWVVSSSLQGLLTAAGRGFQDGRKLLSEVLKYSCDLRIMMTDPREVEKRAKQEDRGEGEITSEVKGNLEQLKRIGVKREQVRYYRGTPTVFALATQETMLLNPYPYEAQAFSCFSLVVQNSPEEDVFDQYLTSHFDGPWKHSNPISVNDWDNVSTDISSE
jgi:hypothetical protein